MRVCVGEGLGVGICWMERTEGGPAWGQMTAFIVGGRGGEEAMVVGVEVDGVAFDGLGVESVAMGLIKRWVFFNQYSSMCFDGQQGF